MIKDLHIKNYRLFEDFRMEGLGQVNLISGKNNTGKTALLEALRIWASRGDDTVISNIIFDRGQFIHGAAKSFDSLVPRGMLDRQHVTDAIEIIINDLVIERIEGRNRPTYNLKLPEENNKLPLELSSRPEVANDSAIFIPFYIDKIPIQEYWKDITLTPLEDEVVKILQCIEPKIQRLDVLHDGAKVRLDKEFKPVSLKNLGDGANRVLVLALALVTAKNKMILIDEFEAGLHHTVQEQLWEIIFEYAQKWNIQVFATTHSLDTVETFFYVMDKNQYKGMGKFYRLQYSRKGPVEAIAYGGEDLQFAIETKLDLR